MCRNLHIALSCYLAALGAWADSPIGAADHFVATARAGHATSLAEMFHYPSSYSSDEREEDVEAVAVSLAWLLEEFGSIEEVTRVDSPAVFFGVEVMSADFAYWESVSPIKGVRVLYSATFANRGFGYIQVNTLLRDGSVAPEIRSITFGIPTGDDPQDAREQAIDVMLRLAKHKKMQVPDDFEDVLRQFITAVEFVPEPESREGESPSN